MRLAEWRKQKGWTQERLAGELETTQPYVSAMERARDPAIPGRQLMVGIYVLTEGVVRPDDFYALPDLVAEDAA